MRLQTKVVAAALLAVIVAVGLSMIEAPPDEVSAKFQRAAVMATTGAENVRVAGLFLVDKLAERLLMGGPAKDLHFDDIDTCLIWSTGNPGSYPSVVPSPNNGSDRANRAESGWRRERR